MRMCWPSDSRQPCSAFSCIAVTTASPSGWMAMRDVAALPFQLARTVGLGRDEPQRGAVVVRRGDALAAGVEGQAGDAWTGAAVPSASRRCRRTGGWTCRRRRPAGPCPSRRGGWRRAPPISSRSRRCRCGAVGVDAAELPVVAAGDEAGRRGVGCEREDGAVMRRDGAPGFAVGDARPGAACRRRARRPAVVPARSKQAATTKASSSRWVPRDSSRNWATVRSCRPLPSPPAGGEAGRLSRAAGEGRGGGAAIIAHSPRTPRTRAAAAGGSGSGR